MSDVIWDLAESLRDIVVAGYAAKNITLPARRFVSNGDVAMDNCEQFAVQMKRNYEGLPGAEDITPLKPACLFDRSVEFDLWIIHCAPTMNDKGTPPSVHDLEASAEVVMRDAATLPWILYHAYRQGVLNECDSLLLGPVLGHGPEGGVVGIHMRVEAQLSYEPASQLVFVGMAGEVNT